MSDETAERGHPAAEKLSAYQANELSPKENDAIQEHVASCRLCAERLLDLQRFLDFVPDPSRAGVVDLEAAGEWAKLRERIEMEQTKSLAPTVTAIGQSRGILGSPKTAYGLAAVLALALVGLSAYTLRLRQELRGPEMNSRAVYLPSLTMARGLEDQVETIELAPQEEARVTFSLEAPRRPPFPKFRLELRDAQGGLIVARDDLNRQDDSFVFTLPTEGLREGRYSIEVRGLRGDDLPLVGRYEFRIRRS